MRNLVSIKTIDAIRPIDGADAIVLAILGGWQAVVRKDEFAEGQSVAYFEIDAFLPEFVPGTQDVPSIFETFAARGRKHVITPEGNESTGHVLKTARLRGALSQGLVLDLNSLGLQASDDQGTVDARVADLGVFKYEPPLPAGTGGQTVGAFAVDIVQKTDSERVQNLSDDFLQSLDPKDWIATEKVDGTSATFIREGDKIRAFSRNWEISPEDNAYGSVIAGLNLLDIMPDGAVVQGEIFGPGIQGNPVKINALSFLVFNSKMNSGFESTPEWDTFLQSHAVPVVDLSLPQTIEEALAQVFDRKSLINPQVQSEGVVWWNVDKVEFAELGFRPNFKAINNKFLLKQK